MSGHEFKHQGLLTQKEDNQENNLPSLSTKIQPRTYLIIGLDDSKGWKLYFLKSNESFYQHYWWFPDGKPPPSVEIKANTNMVSIQLDQEWNFDRTGENCLDDKSYFQTGY